MGFAVLSRGQVGLGFDAVGVELFGDSRGCSILSNQLEDVFDDLFFLVVRDEQLFILTVIVTERRVSTIPMPKPYVSWRKKFLMVSLPLSGAVFIFTSGLASDAWGHFKASLKPEKPEPSQPEQVTLVQPKEKFPPLPGQRSQQEFRYLIHWINRTKIVPFDKAVVRKSPNGKFRYEYEAPITHSKQIAMRQFTMMKARLSRYTTKNGSFREVPISKLHEHFVTGCHFRTERDSILLVIEKANGKYRVVMIAQ